MFGVFRVKNHDFTQKNHIFSNFRGCARRVRLPLDPPLVSVVYFVFVILSCVYVVQLFILFKLSLCICLKRKFDRLMKTSNSFDGYIKHWPRVRYLNKTSNSFDGYIKHWPRVGYVCRICVQTGAPVKFEANLKEHFYRGNASSDI
jgi:hypothetical protein